MPKTTRPAERLRSPKQARDGVIQIAGARVHNLQNVDVEIPRDALTVITGVSGSGKSSLAFDTLYAEGQRQYVDSLSAYARQFLDQIPRPDVDWIVGLAPTLAIDQKSGAAGARSTVATITEIYDYLRVLFARVGVPHCGQCGAAISTMHADSIRDLLLTHAEGTKLVVMAPLVRGRRGSHREVLEAIRVAGLIRARVDGEIYLLEDVPSLAPRRNHTIEAVVDRLVIRGDIETRLSESISLALRIGEGLLTALVQDDSGGWTESIYNTAMACIECGHGFAELEPRTFSFNSPYGACESCEGLGTVTTDDVVAICPACEGGRLKPDSLRVTIGSMAIHRLTALPLHEAADWMRSITSRLSPLHRQVASPIQNEVVKRIEFLMRVGVGYLTLDRPADSLSGGELQRVRLATSIGSGLVGVCYVLDEPSIGLHPADHDRLIESVIQLKTQGNTVVVVEHDEATMLAADHLIDMGPGAGSDGGRIISQGTPRQVTDDPVSITGKYLSGALAIPIRSERRNEEDTQWMELVKASTHNLKDISVRFPLGRFVCVTGVSGSGKSSLVNDTLYPAIAKKLGLVTPSSGKFQELRGFESIDKVVRIDQSPIGRSPRSCPATYAGVLDEIRKVYAATREAKTRGYAASRFSFNSAAGQCELCKGHGVERIEMNFLSDLFVTCTRCGGRRFNRQTLQVRFKGASVADVLDMTVDQATTFFENVPRIEHRLQSLRAVGLGYVHLGQPSTTLSGGEAQRIKLGTELARRATGQTLYLLDEPTTGLHFADVQRLVEVLQTLVDAGNTVLVIEHNTDLIAAGDWVIDLGPEGGLGGGHLLAEGTPEEVADHPDSATGRYLRIKLRR